MSSGMWFAVCIPKKEYEIQIKTGKDKEKSGSKETLADTVDDAKEPPPPPTDPSEKDPKKDTEHAEEIVTHADSKTTLKSEEKEEDQEKKDLSDHDDMVYFVDKDGPMEEILEDILQLLGIKDAVWLSGKNEKFHQVYFPCESGAECDEILRLLLHKGIGTHARSTIGVIPCSVFYREFEEDYGLKAYDETIDESKKELRGFKSMQEQFLKSVTARLTVAQVVESVRAQAQLTFDYIMFITLASMIAALGLLENSSVAIVASMLVSPLMGPIMAVTFGAVIRDRSLVTIGIKSELIGMSLCVIIGLLFGLICGNFDHQWGPNPFPTNEMFSRGMPRSLWVGVLIALPSGAGVALSILGGNSGSLVGVAISASLLPPAVNAGLLWGVSLIKHFKAMALTGEVQFLEDGTILESPNPLGPPMGYQFSYFEKMDAECALLGLVSLLLTVVNIICIIFSAYAVLKIKEVAPYTSVPSTARFWKHDLKIARGYNKTVGRGEGKQMGRALLKEWAQLTGLDPNEILDASQKAKLTQMQTLDDILQDVKADNVYQTVIRNVPGGERLYTRLASWPPNEDQIYGDVDNNQAYTRPRAYTHMSPIRKALLRQKRAKKQDEYGGVALDMESNAEDVQLRHPKPLSPEAQRANTLLRRSLSTAANSPYSLWPTSGIRHYQSRFVVTKVPEALPPLPPRYSFRPFTPTPQMESNL